ncbi:LPXTG cell wall anchor domain-containing protein [Zongyangia hominis]|uniref:LPXTG cell wall anchor domain-containing protein n=1 Tax=Zongyangia hominis TaxID=2763677 RepID=A0A926IBZ8_9FIRM|nr:LPXTG cell wall anchor domain-containing protein [Zongyangia hominis]MBC8570813.1 LPXTG cell wall anchor domain-containing protein [Zongyangia hominis]
MKRALSLVLAVVLCFSLAATSFAIDIKEGIDFKYLTNENGDNYATEKDTPPDPVFVNGDDFYVVPKSAGDVNVFSFPAKAEDKTGAWTETKITNVDIVSGSTTIKAAFYYDNSGTNPKNNWLIQIRPEDLAAVKGYVVKVKVSAESTSFTPAADENSEDVTKTTKYEDTFSFTVQDKDMIEKTDIDYARLNNNNVVDTDNRYVVSYKAFQAIKSGEKFTFPYDGYKVTVGSGIKETLNFRAQQQSIDKVAEKYGADSILSLLAFADSNKQPATLKIDVEATEFSSTHKTNKAYVYRIEGDKLVLVTENATYDSAREYISFETDRLGAFVISAKEIKGASNGSGSGSTTDKTNPSTGANDVVGLAIAGAVVAAAAGFVALKK